MLLKVNNEVELARGGSFYQFSYPVWLINSRLGTFKLLRPFKKKNQYSKRIREGLDILRKRFFFMDTEAEATCEEMKVN